MALDTGEEARDRLLAYLMNSFRLPQNIWHLLDERFDIVECKEELSEKFPVDFLEYISREIKKSSLLPLDLFQGDEYAPYDQFISLLNQSSREINVRELEAAQKTLEELKELKIYHPYGTINEIRMHLLHEKFHEARKLAEELYLIYPEDTEVILYMGETAYYLDNPDEAIGYYDQVIEKEPDAFLARYGKADCLRKKKEFKAAKELLIELWKDYPYSAVIDQELNSINKEVIEEYRKEFSVHPEDMDAGLELGWSYLQNKMIEERIEVLSHIVPDNIQRFSYENLSRRLYLESGDAKKALEHLKNWEQLIRELPDEVPEKLIKEKERLHLPIYFQAYALNAMGDEEGAFEKLEESLRIKKDVETLNYKAYLLYKQKRYEEAVEVCNEMETIDKQHIGVYANRGKSLYEMGYYQAAFEDFDTWIEIYEYDLEPYIYKMRILIYHEQYQAAKEIADYLESQQVKSDRLKACRAQITWETGDTAEKNSAYEMYKEIVENYEKEESDVEDIWRIYYEMAVADENDRKVSYIIEEIDKGLSYKEDYVPLLEYKAYILKKDERENEALDIYKKILAFEPEHPRANLRIADILYNRQDYQEALSYYEKQEKTDDCSCRRSDKTSSCT